MGGHLKDTNDRYYAIGFDFNRGSLKSIDFKTRKLVNFTVGNAQKGSSGLFFSELNMPAFFIDIAAVVKSGSPTASYFKSKIRTRGIGAMFNRQVEKNFMSISRYTASSTE